MQLFHVEYSIEHDLKECFRLQEGREYRKRAGCDGRRLRNDDWVLYTCLLRKSVPEDDLHLLALVRGSEIRP
jgi:hypothetical protein